MGAIKVVISQDLSIQFEKEGYMKPKSEAALIHHLRVPNWGPLLKYTNAGVKHFNLLQRTFMLIVALDSLKKIRNSNKIEKLPTHADSCRNRCKVGTNYVILHMMLRR